MTDLKDFKIRGSSAGIFRNNSFQANAANGCPRRTLLRHLDVQETPSAFTKQIFEIGFGFERYYAQFIPGAQFDVEVKVGKFVGHADAVDDNFVYETKSCTSKNTEKLVFKQNTPKAEHITQLVLYMIALERETGKLVYGNYVTARVDYSKLKKMNPKDIPALMAGITPSVKEFLVTISEDGAVNVDGKPFENMHVSEFLAFEDELVKIIENEELPPRVEALKDGWGSDPCSWCPLKVICDSNPSDIDEFVESAKELFDALSYEN